MPRPSRIAEILGGTVDVATVPVPIDCTDGITEAFYARPECFLDPAVRRAQSGWAHLDDAVVERAVEALRREVSGEATQRGSRVKDAVTKR